MTRPAACQLISVELTWLSAARSDYFMYKWKSCCNPSAPINVVERSIKRKKRTSWAAKAQHPATTPSVIRMATAAHVGGGCGRLFCLQTPGPTTVRCVPCFTRPKRRQITRATVTACLKIPSHGRYTIQVCTKNTTIQYVGAGMAVTRHGFEFKVYTAGPTIGVR